MGDCCRPHATIPTDSPRRPRDVGDRVCSFSVRDLAPRTYAPRPGPGCGSSRSRNCRQHAHHRGPSEERMGSSYRMVADILRCGTGCGTAPCRMGQRAFGNHRIHGNGRVGCLGRRARVACEDTRDFNTDPPSRPSASRPSHGVPGWITAAPSSPVPWLVAHVGSRHSFAARRVPRRLVFQLCRRCRIFLTLPGLDADRFRDIAHCCGTGICSCGYRWTGALSTCRKMV